MWGFHLLQRLSSFRIASLFKLGIWDWNMGSRQERPQRQKQIIFKFRRELLKIAAQPFQTFGASPFANCRCFRLCRQNSTWQLEFVGLLTWTHDSRLTCRRWSSSHFGNFKFHTFFAVLAVVSRSWRVLAQIRQTKFIFSFIITTIDSQRANKNSESFGSATASHQSCELLSIVPAIV